MAVEIVWSRFQEVWLRIERVRGAIVKTTNFDEILIRALSSANSCNEFTVQPRSGCSRSPRKPRYLIMIVKRCSLSFLRCPNRLEISPKWSEQQLVWWTPPSPMFQCFFRHSQAQLDRDCAVYMSPTIFWVSKSIGHVAWHFGEPPEAKNREFSLFIACFLLW